MNQTGTQEGSPRLVNAPPPRPPPPDPRRASGEESPLEAEWSHATVITPIHCRQCGYYLRGLRADSRCPECGLEIWQSVLHTVDPAASRLPMLRNPRAVGDGIFVLTMCMLLG